MSRRDQSYRDQPSLFDARQVVADVRPETLARRSHPETSTEAAATLIDSGNLSKHESAALQLVHQYPGRTGYEIDRLGGVTDRYRKRLAGLATKGKIKRGEKRVCSVKGSQCVTWNPIIEGQKEDE